MVQVDVSVGGFRKSKICQKREKTQKLPENAILGVWVILSSFWDFSRNW